MTSPESPQPEISQSVDVWDLPTRLFHWALVIFVATSLLSEELGNMDIHVISGHVVLALILFRIVWGFIGGRHARFSDFIKGPKAVLQYAKSMFGGSHSTTIGHNPLGALSVIALLGILAIQAGTGLFANDDILVEGPLFELVTKETSDMLTYYHGLSSNFLYGLIALHFAAVGFYTIKGHKILGAMINGKKEDIAEVDTSGAPVKGNLVIALVILMLSAAIAWYIFNY